jgi:site-specific recombinase XerD
LPYIQDVKRSWLTDVSILKKHLLPRFELHEMQSIRPYMVHDMVKSMAQGGLKPASCNRALILLRFTLNCTSKWELIETDYNPCVYIKEVQLNNTRDRFLTVHEFKQLQQSLSKSKNT